MPRDVDARPAPELERSSIRQAHWRRRVTVTGAALIFVAATGLGARVATAGLLLDGNDPLDGPPGDDVICGGDGNDRIDGEGGDDRIFGGRRQGGRHRGGACVGDLSAETYDDRIDGGTGKDFIGGGPGPDVIRGDAGADELLGQGGHDDLRADDGAADPVIDGGSGDDTALIDPGVADRESAKDRAPVRRWPSDDP